MFKKIKKNLQNRQSSQKVEILSTCIDYLKIRKIIKYFCRRREENCCNEC